MTEDQFITYILGQLEAAKIGSHSQLPYLVDKIISAIYEYLEDE